jgi:Divergent InlB B-repeat domain
LEGIFRLIRSRVVSLVLALVVLLDIGVAMGSVNPLWQELDGSAHGDGVSQTPNPKAAFEARVAVGADDRPVVVYTEYPDMSAVQGAIMVKRWTGSAWELLSGPTGIGLGYEPRVRVAADGAIYVAWLANDANGNTQIRLRVRTTGPGFHDLGGSDSPGGVSGANAGIAAPYSLALDTAGRPLVAFPGVAQTGIVNAPTTPAIVHGTTQVYVRRWTGSAWEFVGSGFNGGGASRAVSFKGAVGNVLHDADMPSLTVDSSGAPVVAFAYYTTINGDAVGNTDIFVTRWNGSAWTAVGPAVPAADTVAGRGGAAGVSNSSDGSFNPSLAAAATGRLVLAWDEDQPTGEIYVRVRVWSGTTSWSEMGGSATGSGFNQPGTMNLEPSIAFDGDGRPIVAWTAQTDFASPSQIFVRRWNGTSAWDEIGFHSASEGGISDATIAAFGASLAPTPSGTVRAPTVAWQSIQDEGDGQAFLRQLFSGATVPLTVRVTGSGTVTSDPASLQCAAGSCVTNLPGGTAVTLVPQAAPGWTFTGWSGSCSGVDPCTVNLTTPRRVSANFGTPRRLTLTVATPPGTGGQGAVASIEGPGGACPLGGGSPCTADVLTGSLVVLKATPAQGNRFLSWSGGPCHGRTTSSCAFTVPTAGNLSITALFRGITLVSVGKLGNGTGMISYGDAIACGGRCAASIFTGIVVTLTPTPATGSIFTGWSGGVCPLVLSNGACRFTASGPSKSLTATFQLLPPGRRIPSQEVVLDVPPALCGVSGGTLREVPSGDSTGYLCVRTLAP